jgi:hypothetical protein
MGFQGRTKTLVERMEVATLYESERSSPRPKLALPAASTVCLQFWRSKDIHSVDPEASKNHHVRILRIEQQLGQWIHRLLKVHFLAVTFFS